MSADLLRRAAEKLREHAEAATRGPWEHVDHGVGGTSMGCGEVITLEGGEIACPSGDLYPRGGYNPRADMAYIAFMHPPVALALADWLDYTARDAELDLGPIGGRELAVKLARAILREGSDG